jgi:hypothetical protein
MKIWKPQEYEAQEGRPFSHSLLYNKIFLQRNRELSLCIMSWPVLTCGSARQTNRTHYTCIFRCFVFYVRHSNPGEDRCFDYRYVLTSSSKTRHWQGCTICYSNSAALTECKLSLLFKIQFIRVVVANIINSWFRKLTEPVLQLDGCAEEYLTAKGQHPIKYYTGLRTSIDSFKLPKEMLLLLIRINHVR